MVSTIVFSLVESIFRFYLLKSYNLNAHNCKVWIVATFFGYIGPSGTYGIYNIKWRTILVGISAIASLLTISTNSIVFADPQHCDRSGWPSCYSVGFENGQANSGTSCPSGYGICMYANIY